jgi:hypothetical protein
MNSQAGARHTITSAVTTFGGSSSRSWNWQNTSPSFNVPLSSEIPVKRADQRSVRRTSPRLGDIEPTDEKHTTRHLDSCSPLEIL